MVRCEMARGQMLTRYDTESLLSLEDFDLILEMYGGGITAICLSLNTYPADPLPLLLI
jgi:hypothetical protein